MIVCVIQARVGSKRFPGKVLADLNGEPMLAVMLRRLAPLEKDGIVDHLVVATTEHPEDDAIRDLCHDRGVYCYRGSSGDVLSRFVDIADEFGADTIVRLTADCPLMWAGHVERVLKLHDGGYTACLKVDGFEVQVFDRKVLKRMGHTAYEREHLAPSPAVPRYLVSFPKLSVDTPADLERVREFLG